MIPSSNVIGNTSNHKFHESCQLISNELNKAIIIKTDITNACCLNVSRTSCSIYGYRDHPERFAIARFWYINQLMLQVYLDKVWEPELAIQESMGPLVEIEQLVGHNDHSR